MGAAHAGGWDPHARRFPRVQCTQTPTCTIVRGSPASVQGMSQGRLNGVPGTRLRPHVSNLTGALGHAWNGQRHGHRSRRLWRRCSRPPGIYRGAGRAGNENVRNKRRGVPRALGCGWFSAPTWRQHSPQVPRGVVLHILTSLKLAVPADGDTVLAPTTHAASVWGGNPPPTPLPPPEGAAALGTHRAWRTAAWQEPPRPRLSLQPAGPLLIGRGAICP